STSVPGSKSSTASSTAAAASASWSRSSASDLLDHFADLHHAPRVGVFLLVRDEFGGRVRQRASQFGHRTKEPLTPLSISVRTSPRGVSSLRESSRCAPR